MLQAYNEFRSVAHFWGALLYGQQHDRQDIWPGALETLPTFLAYAEAILETRLCPALVCGQSPLRRQSLGGVVLHSARANRASSTLAPAAK